jgi:hypothetical protein
MSQEDRQNNDVDVVGGRVSLEVARLLLDELGYHGVEHRCGTTMIDEDRGHGNGICVGTGGIDVKTTSYPPLSVQTHLSCCGLPRHILVRLGQVALVHPHPPN